MNVTQTPETLVVTRDGHLDKAYYRQINMEHRKEALKTASVEAGKLALRSPLLIGKGIVYLFAHGLSEAIEG